MSAVGEPVISYRQAKDAWYHVRGSILRPLVEENGFGSQVGPISVTKQLPGEYQSSDSFLKWTRPSSHLRNRRGSDLR